MARTAPVNEAQRPARLPRPVNLAGLFDWLKLVGRHLDVSCIEGVLEESVKLIERNKALTELVKDMSAYLAGYHGKDAKELRDRADALGVRA